MTSGGSSVLINIHSVAASILSQIGSEICGGVKGGTYQWCAGFGYCASSIVPANTSGKDAGRC